MALLDVSSEIVRKLNVIDIELLWLIDVSAKSSWITHFDSVCLTDVIKLYDHKILIDSVVHHFDVAFGVPHASLDPNQERHGRFKSFSHASG